MWCMYERRWSEFNPLGCQIWVHKPCSGIKTSLRNCEDFICETCSTTARGCRSFSNLHNNRQRWIWNCYRVLLSWWCHRTGRWLHWLCECSYWTAWNAFHELLPILTNIGISFVNQGKVFKACVRSLFLYESETWLQKNWHELKDVTMQWFVGYAMLRQNRRTLLKT